MATIEIRMVRKATKREYVVEWEVAKKDGSIETTEGKIEYKKGDIIVTDKDGKKLIYPRVVFHEIYETVD